MKTVFFSDDRCPVARALATGLARDGWRVICNAFPGERASDDPMPDVERVSLSLLDIDGLKAFFQALGPSLRGVVHPAPPVIHAPLMQASIAQYEAAREEGPLAAMLLTRAAAETFTAYGRGSVVYLGSIHDEKAIGDGFLHSMNCAATQMLCREAALCYGAKGVCFHYVARGFIAEDAANDNPVSCLYTAPALRHPQNRLQSHDELLGLVAFLLTDAAAPLNGADLRADGGALLYYGKPREEVRVL